MKLRKNKAKVIDSVVISAAKSLTFYNCDGTNSVIELKLVSSQRNWISVGYNYSGSLTKVTSSAELFIIMCFLVALDEDERSVIFIVQINHKPGVIFILNFMTAPFD